MSVISTPLPTASPSAHRVATTTPTSRPSLWIVPVGSAAGVALGVLARVWMRLIAEDPEFSWAGTLFIVGAFGIFGTAQSLAWVGRQRKWSRPRLTVVRAIAVVLTLPIFTGAGAFMLPTVATASLATWRADWHRVIRAGLAVLSAPLAVYVAVEIIDTFGFAPATFVRVTLFVAIYAVVVAALSPTVAPQRDGWRFGRRTAVITGAVVAALIALFVFLSAIGV
jgi:hypothetical protein